MFSESDKKYLLKALDLAKIQRGFCAPNPSVGAIIVSQGEVIAEGFHLGPGHAHAEVDALKKLNSIPDDAILYVTLEPCCHFGKTPPCTDAIIASGIKKVFYGFKDPNPIVSGFGAQKLKDAGIDCRHLPLTEIDNFYQSYTYWHQTKLPYVKAKIAISLDGKIASSDYKPIPLTSDAINRLTHQMRKESDAILTTVKTIIADDPQFNARVNEKIFAKSLYIIDRELKLPKDAKIFSTAKSITIFYDKNISEEKLKIFSTKNIRLIPITSKESKLDLKELLQKIGEDGVHDLWIEAGGKSFSAFLEKKLVNLAYIYIAPKIIGDGIPAFEESLFLADFPKKENIHFEKIGVDILTTIRFS